MNMIKKYPAFFIPAMLIQDFISRKPIKENLSNDWSDCLKHVRRYGVSVAPLVLDLEFINNSKEQIEDSISQSEKFGTDFRIFDIEKSSTYIKQNFSHNPQLYALTKAYMHSHPTLQTTLGAKLTYAPDNLGSGQGWHRDSYTPQFKAMVYLSEVDSNTGPFEYVLESHRYSYIVRSILDNKKNKLSANNSRFKHEDVIDFAQNML